MRDLLTTMARDLAVYEEHQRTIEEQKRTIEEQKQTIAHLTREHASLLYRTGRLEQRISYMNMTNFDLINELKRKGETHVFSGRSKPFLVDRLMQL